ncbi:Predicted branched-chain amino acid permease (azaleucine resistance) [Fulvimarina manganoxydans]|uniref:Predicted branched-chain amino acid permease (Azaleucine resistance) n=1 Tax=Fulvimarina manganoxydans TaxID=937218 RepID=A0A1W2E389_9HYPH|nr:AzlC family ABC transporter permease [Fulvimarina manganoxydans]SMD04193.1 Predicted branched-chain amino acid permease (azaleucine resistance) [Fulvimarina manganoxydans]
MVTSDDSIDQAASQGERFTWFLRGMRGLVSAPALILMSAFLGFAGLCREAGITWIEASFLTLTVWALPAQIIILGAVVAGASLPAAAFAVTLSSVRLMPMVVALMPELRGAQSRKGTLLFLSHFVAVTSWVFAMERLRSVPRNCRTSYYAGFAVPLTLINTVIVAIVFNLMDELPAMATGALAFLTPVYFLCSLYGSARETSGRMALGSGMLALPIGHWLAPGFELLVAGLLGGVVAYLLGRAIDGRRVA